MKYSIKDANGDIKLFNNQKEFADGIGINLSTLRGRLNTMSPQEAYDKGGSWKTDIKLKDGTVRTFTKKKDLADEIGISPDTLSYRLKSMSAQEVYDKGSNIWKATIKLKDGTIKTFIRQKDLADEIGINKSTLSERLKTMTPQEAYDKMESRGIVIKLKDGSINTFTVQKDLADEIGIHTSTFSERLKTMTPQEAYDKGTTIWEATIKLKDGTIKTFIRKIDLADEIGINYTTLIYRLKTMTPQEAYDMDFKYYAFKEQNSALSFFSKKYNANLILNEFNKMSIYVTLEEYIIMKKLNCRDSEVCIDTENGVFVPIDKFCKDNNLDVNNTLELLRNGTNINDII